MGLVVKPDIIARQKHPHLQARQRSSWEASAAECKATSLPCPETLGYGTPHHSTFTSKRPLVERANIKIGHSRF
jgi:hypothetical protein